MSRLRRPTILALAALVLLLLAIPIVAFAQDGLPVPSADNPNPASVVAYAVAGYALLGALVSVLRPDNPALPFAVPAGARAAIVAGGTVVEACLLAIVHGTPWLVAIGAAVSSGTLAYGTHGRRVTGGSGTATGSETKTAAPSAPGDAGPDAPPVSAASKRGFAEAHVQMLLGGIGLGIIAFAAACGLFTAAVPVSDFVACEAKVAQDHPGATFLELVQDSIASCGAQGGIALVDVLSGILASKDPALAPYQAEARATLADADKMGALRAATGHP